MSVAAIIEWREALTRLSDQYFFDLMRMYLGEVKTPFNKQKLLESLSAFLRNPKNREQIISCLDTFDRALLAGIRELPSPTQEGLIRLFSGTRTFPEVYERILNLEERLLIYRKDDLANREYAINPLFADVLEKHSSVETLVSPDSYGEPFFAPLRVSDGFLAGLYSFFLHEGAAERNDGFLRKKSLNDLEAAFPHFDTDGKTLPILVEALKNLSLLCVHDGVLVPDRTRWELFAQNKTAARAAYLCAAVYGRLTRDALQRKAQSFLDFVSLLQNGGRYSLETVNRLAFLVSEKAGVGVGNRSKFSQLIRENSMGGSTSKSMEVTSEKLPDKAQTALAFGLLAQEGDLVVPNAALFEESTASGASIVVSPTYETVLMPGSSLAALLPLVSFMTVKTVQTVANYDITRKSCAAAFDQGMTGDDIVSLLKKHSTSNLPKNLLFSVKDWFVGYTALSLYHGYVLKVDDSRRTLFENNEHLAKLVRKTLAPGIYLLDTDSPEELQIAAARAGIDFLPAVAIGSPKSDPVPLPPLRLDLPDFQSDEKESSLPSNKEMPGRASASVAVEIRADLIAALDDLTLPREQREELLSRIDRKIIVTSQQLDPESVRPEKMEARGMDFMGKVRIAEQASASDSLLEIQIESGENTRTILGKPLSSIKKRGDVLLKIQHEADGLVETISLGRAVLVRRIRGSIFSEPVQGR